MGPASAGVASACLMEESNGSRTSSSHSANPRLFRRSGSEQVRRDRDQRIGLWLEPRRLLDRIGDDGSDRRLVVGEPIDEGGVGAVLEQPAHEIGEQVLMPADRRIDAAWLAQRLAAAPPRDSSASPMP